MGRRGDDNIEVGIYGENGPVVIFKQIYILSDMTHMTGSIFELYQFQKKALCVVCMLRTTYAKHKSAAESIFFLGCIFPFSLPVNFNSSRRSKYTHTIVNSRRQLKNVHTLLVYFSKIVKLILLNFPWEHLRRQVHEGCS